MENTLFSKTQRNVNPGTAIDAETILIERKNLNVNQERK